jgi:hypothetical protein
MVFSCRRIFLVATLAASSVACEDNRCRTPEAQLVDESAGCVRPAMAIPELKACTPYPPTRGIRVFCLLAANGDLYLASGGDSENLSGTGWRFTGGEGARALSTTENERCAAAMAAVGDVGSWKMCSP